MFWVNIRMETDFAKRETSEGSNF